MQLSRKNEEFIYLTTDGFARLKKKLARIKERLPALIEETQRTAVYGDRSDNAEYKEAKSALRRATWQILSIEDEIKRVAIIKSGLNASGKVELGSVVVLEIDGKEKTFEILGPQETDPARGRISYESPLGAALMGHKIGDIVMIQTVGGQKTYKIIGVR